MISQVGANTRNTKSSAPGNEIAKTEKDEMLCSYWTTGKTIRDACAPPVYTRCVATTKSSGFAS
jgi:hypothetical protein